MFRSSQPQMLSVPDLADLFVPLPDDMLVNLSDSRKQALHPRPARSPLVSPRLSLALQTLIHHSTTYTTRSSHTHTSSPSMHLNLRLQDIQPTTLTCSDWHTGGRFAGRAAQHVRAHAQGRGGLRARTQLRLPHHVTHRREDGRPTNSPLLSRFFIPNPHFILFCIIFFLRVVFFLIDLLFLFFLTYRPLFLIKSYYF